MMKRNTFAWKHLLLLLTVNIYSGLTVFVYSSTNRYTSLSDANLEFQYTLLNSILDILFNTFDPLHSSVLVFAVGTCFSIAFLGAWATPTGKNVGRNSFHAIILAQILFGTHNLAIYYGRPFPPLLILAITILITLPIHGWKQDRENRKTRKQLSSISAEPNLFNSKD